MSSRFSPGIGRLCERNRKGSWASKMREVAATTLNVRFPKTGLGTTRMGQSESIGSLVRTRLSSSPFHSDLPYPKKIWISEEHKPIFSPETGMASSEPGSCTQQFLKRWTTTWPHAFFISWRKVPAWLRKVQVPRHRSELSPGVTLLTPTACLRAGQYTAVKNAKWSGVNGMGTTCWEDGMSLPLLIAHSQSAIFPLHEGPGGRAKL
jgi:hypothetical protein